MMTRYQKALISIALVYLAVPVLIMILNYAADPFDRYHISAGSEDLSELSKSEDRLLLVPANYEDRLLIRKMIQAREKPETVLLGGSRIMNIHGGMVREDRRKGFLNAGVSAGTVADYTALWQLLKQEGKIPRTVYLEIDAQAVYSNYSGDFLWASNAEAYFSFKCRQTGKKKFNKLFKIARRLAQFHLGRLTSWTWTSKSLEKKSLERLPFKLISTAEYDGNSPARTPSFGLFYGKPSQPITREFLEEWGRKNGEKEISYFSDPRALSDEAYQEISDLIREMVFSGVKVAVFIPPAHPKSYEAVKANAEAYAGMMRFTEKVREISRLSGAVFYDGIEENRSLAGTMDFVDGVHLNPETNRKLMFEVDKTAGFSFFESAESDVDAA